MSLKHQDNVQPSPQSEINSTSQSIDKIIEKLPIKKPHIFIVFAAALGFMFDSLDLNLLSFAMPYIIKEWNIDPVTNGLLTSCGLWGMFFGAIFWGPITDKFGRKVGFIGTVLGFSILTGLTALTTNVYQFGAMRFLTGMFLGGMIPVDTALTSEYISAKYRGRFTSILTLLWPFGTLIAALIALNFATVYGWRVLFIIGVIPVLLSFLIRWKVPESPRWLASKGRGDEAVKVLKYLGASDEDVNNVPRLAIPDKKVSYSVLFKPQYLKRFTLTVGYYFFGFFGYYGYVLMLPSILFTVFHMSLVKTFTYTLYVAIFAILGRLTATWSVERFGRKQLFYVGYGFGGVAALLFGLIKDPSILIWGACILTFIFEQAQVAKVVYTPELYPSNIRATATAWSSSVGRISGALSPILLGYFMKIQFYYGIYLTMAICFWITCALVYFLGVETKGKSLDEIGAS
ncbi:MAG: naiP [Paenibacillus sp.]|jgi:putative MFS transporter|nr:naiP [Paenibacillus sp.]